MLKDSENAIRKSPLSTLKKVHIKSPYFKILFGFPFFFPISSDTRRLMHKNAFPFDTIPISIRNEPVSDNIPIADVPNCLVIKIFSKSAAESKKSCITVNIIVSLTILFFIIIISSQNAVLHMFHSMNRRSHFMIM